MVTSVMDASKRLGVPYSTLRLWCLVAGLPVGKVGRAYLVRYDDVVRLVAEKRQQKQAS